MMTRTGLAMLGTLAVLSAAPDAAAQYYPPPGYAPPPGYPPSPPLTYPPRDYYEPPPAYYEPPPPYYPSHALGGRCDSRLRTLDGPRRLVCDIVRPRPLGRPCVCPPPPPPPGYPPGPYLNGRVVP